MKKIKKTIILAIIFMIIIFSTKVLAKDEKIEINTEKITTNEQTTEQGEKINVISEPKAATIEQNTVSVQYETHVQDIGWQKAVKDGETAGTEQQCKRLEAIKIKGNLPQGGQIEYQTHVQDIGWQNWVKTGELAGTEGKAKRLEAIKINLRNMDEYSIQYRTHVENIGWQSWVTDGAIAGTTGRGLRIEAIQIKIIKKVEKGTIKIETAQTNFDENQVNMSGYKLANVKNTTIKTYLDGTEVNGNVQYKTRNDINKDGYGISDYNSQPGFSVKIDTTNVKTGKHKISFKLFTEGNKQLAEVSKDVNIDNTTMKVKYQSHLSNYGWQDWKQNGETSGTTGQSRGMEAAYIKLVGNVPQGAGIEYQAHVADIGWQTWVSNGALAGTTGKAKAMEAIRIKLKNMDKYSIAYRAHVADIGWQDWALDGEIAGTTGQSKRIEAIEIKIIAKDNSEKARINIDSPAIQNSVMRVKKGVTSITGWVMSNTNYTLKIYINNQDTNAAISRGARQDVIDVIKGYGGIEKNPLPGFSTNLDLSGYAVGNYAIKIVAISNATGKELYKSEVPLVIEADIVFETGVYGKTGLAVKGDPRGSDLKYYKIGKGPNVLFATFAIHGFEDLWSKDGSELVTIAENFKNKLLDMKDEYLNNKWTIYIFPGVNLDGINYGTTNNGPGRTTLYSAAPGNRGIDLNRSWATESQYIRYTSSRNYNGTEAFQAYEMRYLRDFLLSHKATNGGQTVLIDLHGWLNQLIGDRDICLNYYGKQYFSSTSAAQARYTSSYGKQYLIGWARQNLGSNGRVARSALIELPYAGINNHNSVVSAKFSDKYINATINMLRGIN